MTLLSSHPRSWKLNGGIKTISYREPPVAVTMVFLTFVVARYMQWGARKDIFATIRLELLLGVVLIGFCVHALSAAPIKLSANPRVKNVVTAIVLLFVSMVLQLPLAAAPDMAWTVFFDRVIKFAMLTLFITVLVSSPKNLRYFIAAFLFACFYVTQESARGALNGGLIWENQGVLRLHGAVPIYAHPNSLAGIALGVFPFAVFLIPVVKRKLLRLIILLPLVTSVICVLYSGSRTGYVGFFVFILYWFSQSTKKWRWILVACVLSIALYPMVPKQYIERFQSISGNEAEGNSKETRMVILEDAVTIFAKNPLGVGVASFTTVRQEMFGRKQDTHNLYLEIATNLGIQGLVVFVILIGAILKSVRWVKKSSKALARQLYLGAKSTNMLNVKIKNNISDLLYFEAMAKAVEGFILVRLTLGLFGMDLYEVYWWFAAGLAISLSLMTKRNIVFASAAKS